MDVYKSPLCSARSIVVYMDVINIGLVSSSSFVVVVFLAIIDVVVVVVRRRDREICKSFVTCIN